MRIDLFFHPPSNFFHITSGNIYNKIFWDIGRGKIQLPEVFFGGVLGTCGGKPTPQVRQPLIQEIPAYRRRQASKAQRRVSAHCLRPWPWIADRGSTSYPKFQRCGIEILSDLSTEGDHFSSSVLPRQNLIWWWSGDDFWKKIERSRRKFRSARLYVARQLCFVASDIRL